MAAPPACPLCNDVFALDDQRFFACDCGYQICRFCWNSLLFEPLPDSDPPTCKACGKLYAKTPAAYKPLSSKKRRQNRVKKRRQAQRKNGGQGQGSQGNQGNGAKIKPKRPLHCLRLLRKNLLYVVGLSRNVATEEVLRQKEYFGKYGKISKIVLTPPREKDGHPTKAYITFSRNEYALRALTSFNPEPLGRSAMITLGTTKYCVSFLNNRPCNKEECFYLHKRHQDEASFTKKEMNEGLHTEYQRRIVEAFVASEAAKARRQAGSKVRLKPKPKPEPKPACELNPERAAEPESSMKQEPKLANPLDDFSPVFLACPFPSNPDSNFNPFNDPWPERPEALSEVQPSTLDASALQRDSYYKFDPFGETEESYKAFTLLEVEEAEKMFWEGLGTGVPLDPLEGPMDSGPNEDGLNDLDPVSDPPIDESDQDPEVEPLLPGRSSSRKQLHRTMNGCVWNMLKKEPVVGDPQYLPLVDECYSDLAEDMSYVLPDSNHNIPPWYWSEKEEEIPVPESEWSPEEEEARIPPSKSSQAEHEAHPPAREWSQPEHEAHPPSREWSQPKHEAHPPSREWSQPEHEAHPPSREWSQPEHEAHPPSRQWSQPEHEAHPPSREWSQPKHEAHPLSREWSQSMHEAHPPSREWSQPKHEANPLSREWSQSMHEAHPPSREWSQPKHEAHPPSREWSQPKHEAHPPSREWSQPKREAHPPSRKWSQPKHEAHPLAREWSQAEYEAHPPYRKWSQAEHQAHPPAREWSHKQADVHPRMTPEWSQQVQNLGQPVKVGSKVLGLNPSAPEWRQQPTSIHLPAIEWPQRPTSIHLPATEWPQPPSHIHLTDWAQEQWALQNQELYNSWVAAYFPSGPTVHRGETHYGPYGTGLQNCGYPDPNLNYAAEGLSGECQDLGPQPAYAASSYAAHQQHQQQGFQEPTAFQPAFYHAEPQTYMNGMLYNKELMSEQVVLEQEQNDYDPDEEEVLDYLYPETSSHYYPPQGGSQEFGDNQDGVMFELLPSTSQEELYENGMDSNMDEEEPVQEESEEEYLSYKERAPMRHKHIKYYEAENPVTKAYYISRYPPPPGFVLINK